LYKVRHKLYIQISNMSEELDFNSMSDMEIILSSKLTLQQKIDETHIIDFIQKRDERYLGVIFDTDTLKLDLKYKKMLKWLTLEIVYQLIFNDLKDDLKYLRSFLTLHVKSLYKAVKPSHQFISNIFDEMDISILKLFVKYNIDVKLILGSNMRSDLGTQTIDVLEALHLDSSDYVHIVSRIKN
jgi:hypothetical protein